MKRMLVIVPAAATVALLCSCGDSGYKFDQWSDKTLTRVAPDLTRLKDGYGRYVHVQGVNLGGSTKVPITEDAEGNPIPATYVGRPFSLDDADRQFALIKALGFNTVRLLFIWEAVEPDQRGVYDTDFLDFFEAIVSKAEEHGIYVLLNAHENLWSRHLWANYNEEPLFGTKGDIMGTVGAIFPYPYTNVDFIRDPRHSSRRQRRWFTDTVKGDGAPKWATRACLPEKNLDATSWGTFRALGGLNGDVISALTSLLGGSGGTGGIDDATIGDITIALSEGNLHHVIPARVQDSTDLLPWTFWGINAAISLDIERCYASFFAGDKVYPGYVVKDANGTPILDKSGNPYNIKEYLQEAYTGSWRQIARRMKTHKNVIGYDIMNEPTSVFIVLTAAAAWFQGGSTDDVTSLLKSVAGAKTGQQLSDILFGLKILPDLPKLPELSAKPSPEEQANYDALKAKRDTEAAAWGFPLEDPAKLGLPVPDLMTMLGLNIGFAAAYLKPLYERVGAAILEEDDEATIWLEEAFSADMLLSTGLGGGGIGGQFTEVMTPPINAKRVVFSPHWYPDIYPFPGFNVAPRDFTLDELKYRDYLPDLKAKYDLAAYQFSNNPTVFGEFGTYFNYNGIDKSREMDYVYSSEILDNFYEAFETLFLGNMVWCYTADNDYKYGDRWNKEDFSVIDPHQVPRSEMAYSRPHANVLPGKPVATHFYSDFHYFDPNKGEVDPLHEFYLEFESKETEAPAEIFVPGIQYPDGFYVWLSDGYAVAEYKTAAYGKGDEQGTLGYHTLYYFPSSDEPGKNHSVTIAQGLAGRPNVGWNYYFKKNTSVSAK